VTVEATRYTLAELEDERLVLVQESEQIQATLGRMRRQGVQDRRRRQRAYRPGDPRHEPTVDKAALTTRLAEINQRLRDVNRSIKSERRRLTTLLEEGSPRPRTAFQYMVALYRLFNDAIPSDEWSPGEQAIMRRARDFVMTGRTEHA
jgi:hypothetical protein